jgi:putative SOS response-associated peptidase YedK
LEFSAPKNTKLAPLTVNGFAYIAVFGSVLRPVMGNQMCGRFTYRLTWPELVRLYRLTLDTPARNTQPRYNICPATNIDAVIEREGRRELLPMRWGLIPSWWSKPLKEMKVATFNARVETLAEKPVFREAFKRTRCLIPASGYYEWQDTPEGKQPYYFTRRDEQPITIAGLWDAWRDKQAGQTVKSCAMVITDANEFVGEVHDIPGASPKPAA